MRSARLTWLMAAILVSSPALAGSTLSGFSEFSYGSCPGGRTLVIAPAPGGWIAERSENSIALNVPVHILDCPRPRVGDVHLTVSGRDVVAPKAAPKSQTRPRRAAPARGIPQK